MKTKAHELRTKAMTLLGLFLSIIAVTPASAVGCFIFAGQILGRGQIGIPITNTSTEQCCGSCSAESTCVAWTWHAENLTCVLKDNVVPDNPPQHNRPNKPYYEWPYVCRARMHSDDPVS